MKKLVLLSFSLLTAALLVSGCDFMRSIAGRPTSRDIEAKKAAIEAVQNRKLQAAKDSVERVRKHEADSAAALAKMMETVDMVSSSSLGQMEPMEFRYYIIIGTFSQPQNAERLAGKYNELGFKSALLPYRKGMTAVALCPTDSIVSLYSSYVRLLADPSCPKSMWVLVNE